MKFRNTLILIGVLLLIAGYVYFFELNKEEEPSAEDLATVVFDVDVEQVLAVQVHEGDGSSVVVARVARESGQPWQIEVPVAEPAYDTKVTNTAQRLAELEATRMLEESPSDPAVYGLTEPRWTFVMTLADGSERTLIVGDQNPTKSGYYVRRGGESPVYLVGTSVIRDISGWATTPPEIPTPTPVPTDTPEPTAGA
jgi:hypothetical protein